MVWGFDLAGIVAGCSCADGEGEKDGAKGEERSEEEGKARAHAGQLASV